MPNLIATPCAKPGCPGATYGRFCIPHGREESRRYERQRGTSAQRGYGGQWRQIRKLVLLRDSTCKLCGRAPSTEADHKTPRSRGGADTLENLQGACKPCHSRKTAVSDGRWRANPPQRTTKG
ncbi:hypothetical protein LCGC14_1644350 [marine sediment metagenome]|uniref:HNH nuclease domain-containing protein n=1 Tax=marine sediment metagenome TaxID=412755 RepID=A0A0F9KYJ3_9ZZZZ